MNGIEPSINALPTANIIIKSFNKPVIFFEHQKRATRKLEKSALASAVFYRVFEHQFSVIRIPHGGVARLARKGPNGQRNY
jgi:hypothetical protein